MIVKQTMGKRFVSFRFLPRAGLLAIAVLAALPATATVRYSVSVARPEEHTFHVTMTIPNVRGQLIVQLPAWNALYQVRDFAYRISDVHASDANGQALSVTKIDKQTWRVRGDGTVTVRYASFWNDSGPFNTDLDPGHAFINLAMVLFYIPERRSEDAQITFADLPQNWRVAIELPRAETGSGEGAAAYSAADYDALVDAPVELGTFEEFQVAGVTPVVRVVVHGDRWNREQLEELVRRVVRYETALMGGAPYTEYMFLYHIGSRASRAGGGMEHANSTAIFAESSGALANVTAHEFFHLWNVKRIRPQSLEPVDYTREQWSRALWFAEGTTNTYASFALVRAGVWTPRQFLDDLAAVITDHESRPARLWKSVEEASLDAWFEKYPVYRQPEFSISYYDKGQILGVLLDILIRDAADNRASLDDVLRLLNSDFARRGRFYRDSADLRAAAEKIAGRSFEDFFARYVASTDELPYADVLLRAGLVLHPKSRLRARMGFWASRGPEGQSIVVRVDPESPAQKAGVQLGDLLLTLNGAAFPRNVPRWLRDHKPGEAVHLGLRRGNNELEVSFVLGQDEAGAFELEPVDHPTEKQRRILDGLLHGTTDPARR